MLLSAEEVPRESRGAEHRQPVQQPRAHLGGDVWVAVAVSAHPGAKADRAGVDGQLPPRVLLQRGCRGEQGRAGQAGGQKGCEQGCNGSFV